ncbi:hypothetical protein [Synechococcus sp. MIT S9452]|uniref:hypothetical protein n=1 Tax=Synechococcus sp. MIT S9452 TaxID=3082546 RepID=UPI0039A5DA37
MKRLTLLGLLSPVALLAACNQPAPKAVAPAPQPAPAPAPATAGAAELTKQGLSACADVLRGQGFFVTDKEIDRPLYEFDAIKENQKWKIKMSGNCEIVLQKLD